MSSLYYKIKDILSIETEEKNFLTKIKEFIFDNQTINSDQILVQLKKYKSDYRFLFIVPALVLSNLIFLLAQGVFLGNPLIISLLFIIIITFVNITFFYSLILSIFQYLVNILGEIINFILNSIVSFFTFISNMAKFLYRSFKNGISKIYIISFKKGTWSLSFDYTIILLCIVLFTIVVPSLKESFQFVDLTFFLIVYLIGLIIIWYQIELHYINKNIRSIYISLKSLIKSLIVFNIEFVIRLNKIHKL